MVDLTRRSFARGTPLSSSSWNRILTGSITLKDQSTRLADIPFGSVVDMPELEGDVFC